MNVPNYPFFEIDGPESAFGCPRDRYLPLDKDAAEALFKAMPTREAADELIGTGAVVHATWRGGTSLDPAKVLHTMGGLLRSFAVSHEIKQATVAVALYHWFPLDAGAQ